MGVRITVRSLWPKKDGGSAFVYEFAQSRIMLGRSRSADVQLPHAAVSGSHASIRTHGAGYALFDEGSTNGTRVNEAPLVPGRPKLLKSNDVVDLGGYRLAVEVGVPVAQTMSARLTADFARRILAEQLATSSESAIESELDLLQSVADEPIELLPIPKSEPGTPPPRRESRPSRPRASTPSIDAAPATPARLGRSELVVYGLAAVVVASSVVAMLLLMRP